MAGKQAKILSHDQVERLLSFASTTRNPIRNRVLVLLSVKAGLRAGEIANLTWPMVLDPSGEIATAIELPDDAAKKRSGRRIPLHHDLRDALPRWRDGARPSGHVVQSERGGGLTPSASSTGSPAYRQSVWLDARPILGAGHSSPGLRGSFIKPGDRSGTFKFSPVTDPFRQPNGTSTATPTPNAG